MSDPVIAIDGPSGAGKGTVSRRVAAHLDWHYLDSGALYRLVALAALREGVDLDDAEGLGRVARDLEVRFEIGADHDELILLAGEPVGDEIRGEEIGAVASRVAPMVAVREALVKVQRGARRAPGLVADGRDMGSVIFPDAGLKIYLTASARERALRRHKQLNDKGMDVSLPALSAEIAARDRRDAAREVSPLRPSPDAVCIDTTGVAIDIVVGQVLALAAQSFDQIAT